MPQSQWPTGWRNMETNPQQKLNRWNLNRVAEEPSCANAVIKVSGVLNMCFLPNLQAAQKIEQARGKSKKQSCQPLNSNKSGKNWATCLELLWSGAGLALVYCCATAALLPLIHRNSICAVELLFEPGIINDTGA